MLVSIAQLLLQLNDVALETTNECCTLHSLQAITFFLMIFRNCVRLVSVSRRCHAVWIAPVAICSSASAWASPLQPRSGLVRSWGGITNSVVRMMAAANRTTTLPTLLSPGGFALRCLPIAVATSCRNWVSVTRHLRSAGGLTGTLNRRCRAR